MEAVSLIYLNFKSDVSGPRTPGQRRSQVSLVGGADRIPGGGINLNTYTYKMSRRAA